MAQRLGDIKALKDLLRNSPLEKRKEVTKSRLTVAEQFMYIHLDQLRAENDRTGKITMEQIETAKRVATVIRDEAIFGKDDPRFDRIEKNLARQHSFRWREALAADEISAPPLAAVDLWGLLQLLAVQFEPGSPGRAPRGADKADGQLDRLEREARRIEGLFSAQTQAHSGLDIGDSDAKAFVKHTEGELRKLETKYGRGLLAGPDNNTPLSPVRPKSSRPTALLFGLENTTDAKAEDDIPYANSNTQLSYGAHEEVYLNHANLSVYELSAAVILLSQPNVRRTVRRLCLARNMLDDTQFCLLLDGLDGTAGLEHLDVSFNRLRHHSAIALAQQLARKRCPQLLELNMGNNRLGDRGAAALMDAVANTGNHIASLSLGAIEVGDRCGERLSECLTTSYYLKHVDFSFNCLGTRGGVAVSEALRTNGRLVRLDFRGCSLGDEGGEALISGLSDAEDLRRIDLSTNRLGARSVAALCSVLEANPLPKLAVFIGDNPLGRHAGSQLIRLSTSSLVASVNMANADLHDTHTPTIGAKAKPNPSTSAALSASPQPPTLPSNLPLMAGSEVAFDATSTHCIYRLNLKFPGNVEVLRELLRRWRKDGRKSWASCHLNGAAVRMNDTLWAAWTAELDARASSDAGGANVGSATATITKTQKSTRSLAVAVPTAPATAPPVDLDPKSAEGEKPQLPPDAEILVEFQTHNVRCPEGQAPVGVDYLRAALREVDLQTTSDEWLMTFICALPSDVYLSAQQAVELLRCFTWSREKVSAAAVLFSRLVDPAAFDVVVRPVLGADEAHKVDEAVGLLERVDARNLTRHYHLDMSLSVDILVAARLLGCWRAEVDAGVCKVAKAFACWRNLRVDGETVDTMEIDPATFRLPNRAILDLDFVSYVECGTTPLLRADLMRSAQLLERQAANPQLTDAMAAVLATALVTEHIRNAEAIVDDMGAATPAFGSNGGGASSGGGGAGAQYNRLEAEVERLGRKLDDAKLAEAPKAEIKEKKARLASAKKRFARLWHTGLMIKMTAAALSRVSDPDFDFDTMPHGEDPTLIPEVRSAEAANRKKSKKKGGKKRGKRGEEEVDVTRLLKVKTRNLDSALRLIRRFAGSYSLTSAQVDLLAALFDEPEHKAEVVVSCYQSIVDLRAPEFARLLHVLPVKAQVELCRRLGWCNTVRMSFPCLHYRLNLALRHDRTMLENLLFLNCELSLNLGSKDYTTDEHNVCCVRNLRVNDTVVEGPIPHNALFSHLVRRGRAVGGRALAILDFKATMAALNRVATEEM